LIRVLRAFSFIACHTSGKKFRPTQPEVFLTNALYLFVAAACFGFD